MKKGIEEPISQSSTRLLPNQQILSIFREEVFDFLVQLAVDYIQCDIGILSFLDKESLWIKSLFSLKEALKPEDLGLVPKRILEDYKKTEFIEIQEEKIISEIFKSAGEFSANSLLVIPIKCQADVLLGYLILANSNHHILSTEQRSFLNKTCKQIELILTSAAAKAENTNLRLQLENQLILEDKVYYSCLPDYRRTLITVTDQIYELLGVDESFWSNDTGIGLCDFILPEDLNQAKGEWTKKAAENQKWEITYRISCADGKRKWVLDKGRIKNHNNGQILEGILLDITDQIEDKQFYQTIFENTDSIICIHDLTGNLLHVNKAAALSLEYDISEDKIESIFKFVREEDTPFIELYFQELEKKEKLTIDLRLKSKNNNSIYWSCRVSKLERKGITSFIISAWDVTEKLKTEKKLKESEQLFTLLSENLSDVLYVYDVQTDSFDYISPNTLPVIGVEKDYFTSVNNFIGDFVEDGYKEKCIDLKKRISKGEGYVYEYPITINKKTRWIHESVQPVKGKNKFVGRVTNISQRKQTYLELTNTKSILEDTGKIALVGGWSYDVETEKLTWTSVTKMIHEAGEEYEPSVKEGLEFYVEGKSRDLVSDRFAKLLNKGESFDVEAEIITVNGLRKWVRSIGKAEYHLGNVVRAVGIFQDITEKINQIQELEKAKQMLESIFNELNDVIWSVEYPAFNLLFISPSCQQLCGDTIKNYHPEKSILHEYIHPNDGHMAFSIASAIKVRKQYSLVYRIISKSGEIKWVKESAKLITNQDGMPLRVDGKIIDITRDIEVQESMNSQLKLQDILMKIATDYINLDIKKSHSEIQHSLQLIGEYTEVDRAYIFEYDWEKKTCTNTFEWCGNGITAEIENLKDIPLELIPQWVETHQKKEFMYVENVDSLDEDDELKKILAPQGIKTLITIPIYFEDTIYGFVGFDHVLETKDLNANEISLLLLFAKSLANLKNRSILEEAVIEEKNRVEQTSRFKSEFLSNMSHEIRTPLNGVIGFTDLLLKTPLSHAQKQYAENANVAGKSLLGIVSDILDFSKIESGKLDLEPSEENIYEIAYSCIDIIKFTAAQKQIELICNIEPGLPKIMELDPVRIKQVLINLLGNAVKFTEYGEVELQINFEKTSESRGMLSCAIKDTGIGISEEQQKKLFKSFSQADSSISRKYGGTGLGLTISNLLVQKMGGNIHLDSIKGKGTTFSFTFETNYKETDGDIHPVCLFKKVLLVDDNTTHLFLLEKFFKFWKIDFLSTSNPIEALEILQSDPSIDLALVDHRMPGIDGIELIQIARNELLLTKDNLEFIFLHSSLEGDSFKKIFNEFDIALGLIKPINLEDLLYFLIHASPKVLHEEISFTDDSPRSSSEKVFQILVAEDIEMNMILIKTLILQQLPKAKIYECSNGEIAMKTFKNHSIDLIFMDVQMPVMDGLTATRKIREYEQISGKTTPIIALTAGALKEEKEKCLLAGMDEFLTKPVQPQFLVNIIEKYLLESPLEEKISEHTIQEDKEENIFDKQALLELIGYDMTLFKALMEASLDLENQLNKLEIACNAVDRINIKSLSHGLKGSCQSLYFHNIQGLVRNLEINAEFLGENEIKETFKFIKEEWEKLKPIVETEIRNI